MAKTYAGRTGKRGEHVASGQGQRGFPVAWTCPCDGRVAARRSTNSLTSLLTAMAVLVNSVLLQYCGALYYYPLATDYPQRTACSNSLPNASRVHDCRAQNTSRSAAAPPRNLAGARGSPAFSAPLTARLRRRPLPLGGPRTAAPAPLKTSQPVVVVPMGARVRHRSAEAVNDRVRLLVWSGLV